MLLGAAPARAAQESPPTFTDTRGHVFSGEIGWMAANGISRGWEVRPGLYEFRPQSPILRGEMAAFLYRLAGEPDFRPAATSPFVDVSTSYVFYKEIAWLAQSGISRGWPTARGAEFRPFAQTSRDVMATFLHRFDGSPGLTTSVSPFTDVHPWTVFNGEITWLASRGISTGWDVGYGCREYRPYQNVTRSEMAAFIYRMENGGTAPLVGNSCAPPPAPLVVGTRKAGAWCKASEQGWYGYTATGVLVQCARTPSDSVLRWRQP